MGEKEIQYRGFKKQKTKNIKLSSEMLLNDRQGEIGLLNVESRNRKNEIRLKHFL
jgi:endonuclease III